MHAIVEGEIFDRDAIAGLVETGIVIDEHTVLRWQGGEPAASIDVAGIGAVWRVERADPIGRAGVVVNRQVPLSAGSTLIW